MYFTNLSHFSAAFIFIAIHLKALWWYRIWIWCPEFRVAIFIRPRSMYFSLPTLNTTPKIPTSVRHIVFYFVCCPHLFHSVQKFRWWLFYLSFLFQFACADVLSLQKHSRSGPTTTAKWWRVFNWRELNCQTDWYDSCVERQPTTWKPTFIYLDRWSGQ